MVEVLRPNSGGGAPKASRASSSSGAGSATRVEGDDPRIAAAASGSREAAESLCRTLLPRVRNLVRYLVRGDGDVDDLAQDGMLEVLRSLPSFRGDSAFSTWADRIVVRTTLHSRRRARSRAAQLRAIAGEQAAGDSPNPSTDIFLARRQLARMLDALPDEQRTALVLHHALGMSVPELASTLDVPFDTAKSRLRLAMTKLRRLQEEGTDPTSAVRADLPAGRGDS